MPLLRNQPFQRLHVSSDFKDDDEVFHCEITNEIFKDYSEYCERIILCNSLIWSCSITGKANMTYEEALQCEENAKKSLKEFPMELRIPILYLASKTNRTSFTEMADDVYQFANNRYFVGEMVEASFIEGSWCDCHVLQVIAPTEQQLKSYSKDASRSPQEHQYHPPAKLFRYEVEQLDCGDSDISQLMIVEAGQVKRRNQHYSKERNRIFLCQLCEQNKNGVWVVKESVLQKYGIAKVRFDTIFTGSPPDFSTRTKKIVRHKQESIEKFLTPDVSKHKSFEKPDPLKKVNESGETVVKKYKKPRTNGKFKEELKAKALEEKAKREEERVLKIERKKKEKQKSAALAAYIKEWNKLKEDLECEDLYPIPDSVAIKCNIPNDKFGDFAFILEFLEFFNEELEINAYFPGGFNLDLLERSMLVKEASGPWSDLLQLLLSNIFQYQAAEEGEMHANESNLVVNINMYERGSSTEKSVKLATIASKWFQTQHGCKLSELTLDHTSLSEILRQHLLSSGGRIGEAVSKWRYSQRGGYTNLDDPALLLRINEAHILRMLEHCSVCEFDLDDRLKLITCLINQLLTFASIRDFIEERHEKLYQARRELKSFMIAEQKKEKMKEREKEGKLDSEEQKPKKVTRGNCEEEKKREEHENKLKELQQAAKDDQMMVYLGADRAHRRYWRFVSIPGIFVENDEWWPGDCLPEGTPYNPELRDEETTYAYLKNKFEDEFSDKENSFKKAKKSPKKITSEKNGIKSPRKDMSPKKDFKHELTDLRHNVMACTGDKDCPVHWKREGPKWSFYGKIEDVETLINSLNKRGIRESELRNNLEHEFSSLISIIEKCPKYKLNSEVFSEPAKGQANKIIKKNKYENANLNFPPHFPVNSAMEMTLRDFILDFEEKIKVVCLGSLKVINRDAWRAAISNNSYDKQCEKLVYGTNENEADAAPNVVLDKVKNEFRQSRPGTPDSEIGSINIKSYKDPGKYLGPPNENEISPDPQQQMRIQEMACAILQLSHAIEQRYLKKPLGTDEKDKKWSSEEARDRWEQSLMASTSWSQLFVHLNALENSVAWGRSAFNAQCRVCRKRRDAENMLLCDGCNKGHHLYCLKPKLNAVPEGDWFCSTCKPPEIKPAKKVKKRKKFVDDIEEDLILTKETRHNRAKRIPESEDEEDENEDYDDEIKEGSDEDIGDKSINVCSLCTSGGKLITCDICSDYFHLECVDPPLLRVPRGKWSCINCKERRKTIPKFDSNSDDTELRQTRSSKRAAENMQEDGTIKGSMTKLQELLADIRHHRDSWPFLSPVTKDEVPDYHDIISNPMDFGTIKYKLENEEYETLQQFFDSCQLVFDNCQTYNQEHSSVYKAGSRLLKYFEKRCKELGLNLEDDTGQRAAKRAKLDRNGTNENGLESEEDIEVLKKR